MWSIEERFESAWVTLSLVCGGSAGSRVSCVVSRRDLVTRLDEGRTLSGLPLPHSDISLKGKYDKDDGLWEDIGHGER